MTNSCIQPAYCGLLLDGPVGAEEAFAATAENHRSRTCRASALVLLLSVVVMSLLLALAQRRSPGHGAHSNSTADVNSRSLPLLRLDAAADAAKAAAAVNAAAAAQANAAAQAAANAAAQAAANAAAQSAAKAAAEAAEANEKAAARANEEAARQAIFNAQQNQQNQAKQLAAAQRLAAGQAAGHHSPKFESTAFYMYRVQSDETYQFENVNAGNVPGILWYLEKEVELTQCPRKFDITRILRFLVTIHPPMSYAHNFGEFVAFDSGVCTTPSCMKGYDKTGYIVGCQNQTGAPYQHAVWYSLPGPCPTTALEDRQASSCNRRYPGGMCSHPDGENNCTWHAEPAGEVSLSEVEGIADYDDFCAKHGNAHTIPFWDGRGAAASNQQRIDKIWNIFKNKFPSMPYNFPEPSCDWG